MSLSLAQTLTAIGPGLTSSFLVAGGTGPYTYSVRPNGAGGTINSSGLYTAPASVGETPQTLYDTIQVVDSTTPTPLSATATILVGTPLLLFCEIIQNQLGLAQGRVYLWDQKVFQPTDSGLYVAVSVPSCKPFANNTSYDGNGNAIQSVNMLATVDIDIISRGPAARDQKEQVMLALMSDYSQLQQTANSFLIAKLPPGSRFLNLSNIDGAAIPYRYKISVNMQYFVTKTQATPYYNTFAQPTVYTNP